MKNAENKIISINPDDHGIAVKRFIQYFDLKPNKPEIEYLQTILQHFSSLPYENISKIVKLSNDFTSNERIRLPEEVMDDHAHYHLGGTCFSLTFFLQSILMDQGFHCYPVIGSMHNRPNAHCALVVNLKKKQYLVDPGYLLTTPMELNKDRPRIYKTPQSGVELVFNQNNEHYFLCTFDRNQSKWRYYFQNKPVSFNMFLQFWYDSFYKSSMHGICMTKIRNNGLVYLHKDLLQISNYDGKQKQRIKNNYHQIVQEIFGIEPQLVEKALYAIKVNVEQQKHLGLFQKNERTFLSETD